MQGPFGQLTISKEHAKLKPKTKSLHHSHVVLGRERGTGDGDEDFVVLKCPDVSRRHAILEFVNGTAKRGSKSADGVQLKVRDLKSFNGTFVCEARTESSQSSAASLGEGKRIQPSRPVEVALR